MPIDTAKVRALCDPIGVSAVAAKAGITRQAIYDVLSGRDVRTSTLERLAAGLDVPVTALLTPADNRPA